MTKHSYIAAAAMAFAFSGASFSNDPAAGSKSSAAPAAPAKSAATQCDSLTGARKEQCMRQAQQSRDNVGNPTGATSGSGTGATRSPDAAPKPQKSLAY